jgi:hypothetical protein
VTGSTPSTRAPRVLLGTCVLWLSVFHAGCGDNRQDSNGFLGYYDLDRDAFTVCVASRRLQGYVQPGMHDSAIEQLRVPLEDAARLARTGLSLAIGADGSFTLAGENWPSVGGSGEFVMRGTWSERGRVLLLRPSLESGKSVFEFQVLAAKESLILCSWTRFTMPPTMDRMWLPDFGIRLLHSSERK